MYVAFLVVKPFISAILGGVAIAYIFYPVYKGAAKVFRSKTVASLLTSAFIILLIVFPLFYTVKLSTMEANYVYLRVKQKLSTGDVLGTGCQEENGTICGVSNFVDSLITNPLIKNQLELTIRKTANRFIESSSSFLIVLPQLILSLFITFFTSYYLFKDGPLLVRRLKKLLPLTKKHQDKVISQLHQTAFAIIYGSIVVALIQGSLGALAFFAVGMHSAIIWGLIMSLCALIPLVGTFVIWGPIGAGFVVNGYITGSQVMLWKGLGLLIWGAFVISTIDNVLKPKIIGDRTQIHPVIVLLGVLGGLKFFGPVGLLAGPLILALALTFLEIYEKEKSAILKSKQEV